MLTTLTGRRERFLVAEVESSTGVERISRTLALDATAPQVRELLGPLGDGWDSGVLVVGPSPGLRLYVLPLVDGVIARWDHLVAAHRRRALLDAAAHALLAMGEPPTPSGPLAEWLAAGASEDRPAPARPSCRPWANRSPTQSGSAWSAGPSCWPASCRSRGSSTRATPPHWRISSRRDSSATAEARRPRVRAERLDR